ncbi:MAG: hypothetical protein R3F62_13120 [Planctomycetota bacterium]
MSGQPNPKDLILQNKGLVIVYAVALIPVILYVVVISGMQEDTAKKLRDLETKSRTLDGFAKRVDSPDPENPLYTTKDIEQLTRKRELYQQEVASLGEVVKARDEPLERVFEDFEGKDKVDSDDFNAKLRTRLNALSAEERFGALVTDPEKPDAPLINMEQAEDANGIKKIQKRFWIQEALLDALKKGNALRLASEIEFLPEPQESEPAYKRLPARVTFFCAAADIPLVVREVLAQDISFRVVRMRVEKAVWTIRHDFAKQFQIPLDEFVFEKGVYEVQLEEHEQFGDWTRWVPEPPLKVELEVEAFDFTNTPAE